MRRLALALAACAAGCGDPEAPPLFPFRDQWQVEVDAPFPYGSAEDPGITELVVGGLEHEDNFANRGDVIVRFTGPPDRILVEMRRFTMSLDEGSAQDEMDAMSLWAYAIGSAQPAQPSEMDEADDCTRGAWKEGCAIRFYYDGNLQLARGGADLRITLPASYRHDLTIVTSDADVEDEYINRGDVCVENLHASLDVSLHSGVALIALADDATPAPTCTAEQIAACENAVDPDGSPAPWSSQCGCTDFALARVETDSAGAADITVDVPPGLWANLTAENAGAGQNVAGEHCEARITVPSVELEETGFPWKARGETNDPGARAVEGAGFVVQAIAKACAAVPHTEDPEDFVPPPDSTQAQEERGNVEICSGCLAGPSPCDALDGS